MLTKLARDISTNTLKKLASPSYLTSLMGGVDPTGLMTFQVGQDEEDRSRDKWHKLLGGIGGVAGGAALIPGIGGAGVGIYENLPKILAAKGWRARAKELGSQMWQGAVMPFTSMKHWSDLSNDIGGVLSKNSTTPNQLKSFVSRMGIDPDSAVQKMYQKADAVSSDALKTLRAKINDSIDEGIVNPANSVVDDIGAQAKGYVGRASNEARLILDDTISKIREKLDDNSLPPNIRAALRVHLDSLENAARQGAKGAVNSAKSTVNSAIDGATGSVKRQYTGQQLKDELERHLDELEAKGRATVSDTINRYAMDPNKAIDIKDGDIRDLLQNIKERARSSLNNIVAGVGLSGGIGGAAALGQFNSGRDSGIAIRNGKAQLDAANAELESTKKSLEQARQSQGPVYQLPSSWKPPKNWNPTFKS